MRRCSGGRGWVCDFVLGVKNVVGVVWFDKFLVLCVNLGISRSEVVNVGKIFRPLYLIVVYLYFSLFRDI